MEQAGIQLIAAGGDQYITILNSATKATDGFVKGTEQAGTKVSAAGQVIIGGLREMGSLAVDAFAKAAKATAGFVVDSVGLAGDFEAGMNSFRVAAGKDIDAKGIEQFHDLFLQLGKDLPVSTSDVQRAAIELVKGGIDPATVAAGGLKQAIQFASAAMEGDLAGAAEVSAKIVAGWANVNATAAEKADLLTHATDLFTKAANASSTDVAQLSRGIFNAQGIAKTAGVSLDDLTTTIAELSGDFSSSAEAGTSLKNMIARLQPTTDPATDAMAALGLYTDEAGSAFYDAQGNFVGFQQASQLLQDSLKGLTKEQQAAALQTIFGNDAMTAAAGLASRGAEGYQVMADSLTNAMGVQEAGATVQAGYNTAMENAKGSVEAFQIQLGEHLLPILTSLLDSVITPGINTLSTFADAVFGSDEAFAQLSPTLQGIVSVIDVVVADTQEIIGAFNDAGAMSSEFGESIGLLASDLGLPGDLIEDIVFAAQDLIKWFSTASNKSSELGGVVDDLSGIWEHASDVIADVMDAYMSIAQAVLPVITRFVDEHGAEISAFFQTSYTKIIDIVNLALDLYDAIVPKVLGSVAGFITDHADAIQTILGGAWDAITGIVNAALALIEGAFKITLDVIHGDWAKAWADIQDMSATFVLSLGQTIEGFLNIIAGFFDTSLQGIVDTWQGNWDQLVDIATQTDWAQVGQDVVDGIIVGLSNAWSSLVGWITEKMSGLIDTALETIGAKSPAKEFMPVGQFSVQGIMKGFADWWPSLTAQVGDLGDSLIKQAADISNDISSAIGDAFGATASIDRQVANNLDKLKDVLPEYRQYTQGALKEAQNQALGFLDPQEGAKFFQMRSKQILEFAKLQQDLAKAETSEERSQIQERMNLINAAQTAEINQFNANQAATRSGVESIIDQVNKLVGAFADIDPKKKTDPMIAAIDQMVAWLDTLQAPGQAWANSYAHPPMMQYPSSSSTTYTGQVGNNYSMPIYTNQSPNVIQHSLAVAQAMQA